MVATSCSESSGFWCSSRRQLISCCSKDIQHLLAVVSLRQQAQGVQARWPVANGGINDEFIQLFFRLQRVKPGFNLFGSTGDQRRFTAGNARRSAAGPGGQKRRPAPHCRRSPAGRSPARRPTPRPAAPARRRWPDRQQPPHRTATIASRGLSSRQRLNTARRSALSPLRWAAKTKFQSRRAASSALSRAGAEQKTVCPARRDRRGA